jgi:hypothetical protein
VPGRFVALDDYDVVMTLHRADEVTRRRRGLHRLVDPSGTHEIDELAAWVLRTRRGPGSVGPARSAGCRRWLPRSASEPS